MTALARPAAAAELVMFESTACEWCEAWDEEIGPIYPKTEEARRAPLRRVDIHDKLPADLAGLAAVVYTPTFVLVEGGREYGRILGYAGEDHFWGLLGILMKQLETATARACPGTRASTADDQNAEVRQC
ncbi:MAG: hypothetical protein QF893_07670 [Alphaproteobacteria bacterium]|jgi:hypothetical protein|nr:hypothetical protein [Alphaproteobacteria bacterium]